MESSPHWNFFTNHGHVIVCLARNPEQPLREVAQAVGITERAVQRIVAELESGGCLRRQKVGRQNTYEIAWDAPLRHPLESHHTIGELLAVILERTET